MKYELYQPQSIFEIGKRNNQEDSIFPALGMATANDRLFIVCDGMGGMEKGEVSSGIVCNTISSFLKENWGQDETLSDELFEKALDKAYDNLEHKEGLGEDTGTTLAFMCLHRGGCLVAHIGDSRIYHIRPATKEVLYRSIDHTQVQMLYDLGELTYWEMRNSQRRNVLRRAVQPFQEVRDRADLIHITDIKPGDYFYLCSDGMTEIMEDDELLELLSDKQISDEQKSRLLVEKTLENSDNHSAHLIHIESVQQEESDSGLIEDEASARAANKLLNDPDYKNNTCITGEVKVLKTGLELKNEQDLPMEVTKLARPIHDKNQQLEGSQSSKHHHKHHSSHHKKHKDYNKYILVVFVILIVSLAVAGLLWLSPWKKDTPPPNPVKIEQQRHLDIDSGNKTPQSHSSNRVRPTRPSVSDAPQRIQEHVTEEEVNNAIINASGRQPQQRARTPRNQQERLGTIVNNAQGITGNRNSTSSQNNTSVISEIDGLVDE